MKKLLIQIAKICGMIAFLVGFLALFYWFMQSNIGNQKVGVPGTITPFNLARDVKAETEIPSTETYNARVFYAGKRVEAEASIINNQGGGCIIAVKITDGGPMILARMINCKEKK